MTGCFHRVSLATAGVLAAALLVNCSPPEPQPPFPKSAAVIDRNVAFLDSSTVLLRFDPPPIYAMWLAEVEQCSGLSHAAATQSLSFWVAPHVMLSGQRLAFYAASGQIVFGLGSENVAWVVRHELLHWLLQPVVASAPVGETEAQMLVRLHPELYYREKCGPLVTPPRQSSALPPRVPSDGTVVGERTRRSA